MDYSEKNFVINLFKEYFSISYIEKKIAKIQLFTQENQPNQSQKTTI